MKWSKALGLLLGVGGLSVLAGCTFGGCTKRKKVFRFQADPSSPVYAAALQAASNWTRATGVVITVTADGDIPILVVEKTECPLPPEYEGTGKAVLGCTMDDDSPDERIELDQRILKDSDMLLTIITHEMGHVLRGNVDHLDDPADKCCIMAPSDNKCRRAITPKDIDFICQCLECPASPDS